MVFNLVNTRPLHRELSERNVDLLIAQRFDIFREEQFGFENLFDDYLVVAAGAQSPWARRRRIELSELVSNRGYCHRRKP
jgi:DNA-binding transcriptional LysR family regulator